MMREETEERWEGGVKGDSEGRGQGNEALLANGNIISEVHVNHPHSMNCIGNERESAWRSCSHTVH